MSESLRALGRRAALPALIFVVTATVYAMVAGPRRAGPDPNNHFAHLAESWLAGQLEVLPDQVERFARRDVEVNDWACFDADLGSICHGDARFRRRESQRWYVSFPPFPAVVILPAVAIYGHDFSDPFFWAIFAGLAPALLYVLLRRLREEGTSPRTRRDDLLLVVLFAFGSVYFSTAVQGSVWFAAHVVASALLVLYLYFGIGAKRPFWAGLMLGLCFLTRPSTYPFALFFLLEAMRASRPDDAPVASDDATIWRAAWVWLRGVRWVPTLRACAIFAAPILAVGAVAMWMNQARFGDPFDFGHQYLMIYWHDRIAKWGLFSYHYFAKNLAVLLASMPWLTAAEPYVRISRHGLALWVTSPNLVPALWPKKVSALMVALFASTALVAILDLCYQNSGWVQFGYRFSLDYMPALIVLLALSRRRFGWGFVAVLVLAVAINAFGAITFNRAWQFYDDDNTQERLFQPD